MTVKTHPEDLTDADLDGVEGGAKTRERQRLRDGLARSTEVGGKGVIMSSEGAEPYVGETEKGIVAQCGDGGI